MMVVSSDCRDAKYAGKRLVLGHREITREPIGPPQRCQCGHPSRDVLRAVADVLAAGYDQPVLNAEPALDDETAPLRETVVEPWHVCDAVIVQGARSALLSLEDPAERA